MVSVSVGIFSGGFVGRHQYAEYDGIFIEHVNRVSGKSGQQLTRPSSAQLWYGHAKASMFAGMEVVVFQEVRRRVAALLVFCLW